MSERWYREAVIYCLDVETFQDSNGDGVGDLPGLISRLDYLERLGVTCLWLNPIHPTPNRDDGYDVSDFYGVDPRLGNLGDFVELIHQAANRGLRVMIDLVVNHTSDQHPWFQAARSDPKSPFRDYYVWSEERPVRPPPGHGVPRRPEGDLDLRPQGQGLVLPPLLRLRARAQRGQPPGPGRGREDHRLLAPAGRGRVPHGRRPVRHRAVGARQPQPAQGLRLPAPSCGS